MPFSMDKLVTDTIKDLELLGLFTFLASLYHFSSHNLDDKDVYAIKEIMNNFGLSEKQAREKIDKLMSYDGLNECFFSYEKRE